MNAMERMEHTRGPYYVNVLPSGGVGIGGPRRDERKNIGLTRDQAERDVCRLNEGFRAGELAGWNDGYAHASRT